MPRRLVAGDQQLVEEHHELVVAQRLAVHVGVREHRDDVVARIAAAGLRHRQQVVVHLGLQALAFFRGPVGRTRDRRFRPLVEARPIGFGDPEQLGNDPQRERDRERLDRIERGVRFEPSDQLVGAGAYANRELANP